MNKYAEFNKDFFGPGIQTIKWYDRQGVMKLTNGRLATITIRWDRTADHYDHYEVEIVSKTTGLICKKVFYFKDYLNIPGLEPRYYLVRSTGLYDQNFSWHEGAPTETYTMVEAILSWINEFE